MRDGEDEKGSQCFSYQRSFIVLSCRGSDRVIRGDCQSYTMCINPRGELTEIQSERLIRTMEEYISLLEERML